MNEQSKKRKKKWLWGIVGLVALVALFVGCGQRAAQRQQSQAAADEEIVTAFVGDLSASATAAGEVQAQREASLALSLSGRVAAVLVEVGDRVAAGDRLLVLETAALERAVASAEQNLVIQEANLAALLAPAAPADVAAAEAAVASAEANLADLEAGPSPDEIAAAEADVRAANADIAAASARLNNATSSASAEDIAAAQIELELAQQAATRAAEQHSTILVTDSEFISEERLQDLELSARTAAVQANADLAAAQETLDRLLNGDASSIAGAQAGVSVAVAQRDAAQARLDMLLAGASASEMAAAEATLAQAVANREQLQRGPTESQVAMATIQLEQAQTNLERAQNNLAQATLSAPFDGLITAVYVSVGEQASGVLVEMVDTTQLEVVLAVDEVDMADISPGQSAVVTLEAWPEVEIESEVSRIAPAASSETGALVTYDVSLALGETELPILVGMTANADLITTNRQDVLLVANAAIQVDRSAGTYSVNLLQVDGEGNRSVQSVEVTIGLRDGQVTEITSGLEAGDQLLVNTASPLQQFGEPGNGGGPFGGE